MKDFKLIRKFTAPFKKKGRHRHKCRQCSKLIQDGEMATIEKYVVTDHYPVKGIMGFVRWHYWHETCFNRRSGYEA